jgi:hypothetical protein
LSYEGQVFVCQIIEMYSCNEMANRTINGSLQDMVFSPDSLARRALSAMDWRSMWRQLAQ